MAREELNEVGNALSKAEGALDREMRRTATLEARMTGETQLSERTQVHLAELEAGVQAARVREDAAAAEAARLRRELPRLAARF